MWNVSEKNKLPPMSLDSSNVDWRYVADEIPQKFRSQESKFEPFNSFCIEAFQKEELASNSFHNQLLPSNETVSLHCEYTNKTNCNLSNDIKSSSQSGVVKDILETAPDCQEYQAAISEIETSSIIDNYAPLWNKLNGEDSWNFPGNKYPSSFDSTLPQILAKPEQIFEENSAYPLQGSQSINTYDVILDDNTALFNGVNYQNLIPEEMSRKYSDSTKEVTLNMAKSLSPTLMKETNLDTSESQSNITQPAASNFSENTSCESDDEQNPLSNFNGNSLEQVFLKPSASSSAYSIQAPSVGQIQQLSGYNLYPPGNNAQSFPALVGKERQYTQTNRDNSAIKFHIRTITHCEVECPAPGTLPLSNQPSAVFPSCAPQIQPEQHCKQVKNLSNVMPDKTISGLPWNSLQNDNTSECNSIRTEADQRNNKELDVVESNHILPLQPGYSNPFQNGAECPRLLVHEQRQTSILIGYPMANNAVRNGNLFANPNNSNMMTSIQYPGDVPFKQYEDPQQVNENALHPVEAQCEPLQQNLYNLQCSNQVGQEIADEATSQQPSSFKGFSQSPFVANSRKTDDVVWSKPQQANGVEESTQINKFNSATLSNIKPAHVNLYASRSPVFGFSASHNFSCLPSTPSWLSPNQSFPNFPPQTPAFEYIVPSSVNINGNYTIRPPSSMEYDQFENRVSTFANTASEQLQNQPWTPSSTTKSNQGKDTKVCAKRRGGGKSNSNKPAQPKRFQCSQKDCSKRFAKEKELQVHVNKHHLQMLKPYFCSYCNKNFKRPDQLKRHEKIHTGEKPHPCSICGRQFARTDHRNTHLKKHNVLANFSSKKIVKSEIKDGNFVKTNGTDKLSNQTLAEENSNPSKESFFNPMRLNQMTSSSAWHPHYIIRHPSLYENQIQPCIAAIHH